jgi:hypothetical protein
MSETETKAEPVDKKPQPQPKKSFNFTSPEALIMGLLAVSLDLIGYVLLLTALDDFWLTDIVGVLFIGSWVLIRGGGTKGLKGKKGIPGLKNFGIASLIEVVPYVGSISPSWTIMVYKELKNNP